MNERPDNSRELPTIGRVVQYRLRPSDVIRAMQMRVKYGRAGNAHVAGDTVPMIVVRVNSTHGSVNGQVFLDGEGSLWVTSASEGCTEGTWHWYTDCREENKEK